MKTMPVQKPGKSKQDYGTPDDFTAAVKLRFGIEEFDIDLAASSANTLAPIYFDQEMDALSQPSWKIGTGLNWLNPPFSHIAPWVEKAYVGLHRDDAETVVLIPAGVGSNWWRDWVHKKAFVLFLNGRLTFKGTPVNPKTGKVDAYPKDCALLVYDRYMTPGYDVWSWQK